MEKIDADERIEPSPIGQRRPWASEHIDWESRGHGTGQADVLNPGVDAEAMARIRVRGLPNQRRKTLLKGHRMLTTAAGKLKDPRRVRQVPLQDIADRRYIPTSSREGQPRVSHFRGTTRNRRNAHNNWALAESE